jgi:hypothetical protein
MAGICRVRTHLKTVPSVTFNNFASSATFSGSILSRSFFKIDIVFSCFEGVSALLSLIRGTGSCENALISIGKFVAKARLPCRLGNVLPRRESGPCLPLFTHPINLSEGRISTTDPLYLEVVGLMDSLMLLVEQACRRHLEQAVGDAIVTPRTSQSFPPKEIREETTRCF